MGITEIASSIPFKFVVDARVDHLGYLTDKSGNNNSATKMDPSVVTNAYNGLSVMRYTKGGYHEWNDLNDIRTVFWVLKADPTNTRHARR